VGSGFHCLRSFFFFFYSSGYDHFVTLKLEFRFGPMI
jgi:hypothetical protein